MVQAQAARSQAGLGGRLMAGLALVIATAGVTAWLVAGAVGPAMFHSHLVQAGLGGDDAAALHAEEAFRSAGALSLTLAVVAAVLAAGAVSWFLTHRIGRSLAALSVAASKVAGGRFDQRVPIPGIGAEFDDLAEAFNQMAARLAASEALRRRLLSDVAHELRTPVATLSAYLDGVEDGVEQLSPATLAVLRDQAARLTRLATDLAAVTRAQSGELRLHRRTVAPAVLVQTAVDGARARFAEAGVALEAEVGADLPGLRVDPERIAQVLANLVDNALRHTPRGGRVAISGAVDGPEVVLTVTDTGVGIAAEHLPHLFERFYRADTARDRGHGGSGIGLAITRALVEAHGGSVTAHSSGPGTGATFAVRLPTAADQAG